MKYIQVHLFSLFSLLFLSILAACGSGSSEADNDPVSQAPDPVPATTESSASAPSSRLVAIQSDSGEEIISLDLGSNETIIKYDQGNQILSGRMTKADKAKYYNQQGDFVAEVKYKDDAFKLRDAESELLWKIKLKPDKIKISDNEENENPYEIKENEAGKFKLKYLDKTLGEAKLKDGKITVKGTATYIIPAAKNEAAYTTLLLKDIPEEHRLIIMAELLKR